MAEITDIDIVLGLPTSGSGTVPTLSKTNTVIGGVIETAPATDTASSGLNGRLQRIAQRLTTLIGSTITVSGTFWQATQPVSIATVPSHAVTNAGAFVTQENGALLTSAQLIDDTITAQGTALGSTKTSLPGGSVTTSAPTYTTGQISPLSLDTAGALRVTGAGGGTQYTEDVAAAADPIGTALMAVRRDTLSASEVSADGDNIAMKATSKGQLHVLAEISSSQLADPTTFVSGVISTAMTGTTSTSLLAAPGASLRNYVTQITVSNSHATVGTDIIIQDGSDGTTLYVIPAAAVYGGAVLSFPTPLRQPTTNTALYCANVTTGSSIKVSASGYKGA